MPAESALSRCKDRISEPCGRRGLLPPSLAGLMRAVLVTTVLALAAPGTAAALSLSSRELHTVAPVQVKRFQLVGIHWRGNGMVLFRTRSVRGRWSVWQRAAPG